MLKDAPLPADVLCSGVGDVCGPASLVAGVVLLFRGLLMVRALPLVVVLVLVRVRVEEGAFCFLVPSFFFCFFTKSSRISWQLSRDDNGSQVFSEASNPFHFTRYLREPLFCEFSENGVVVIELCSCGFSENGVMVVIEF